MIIILNLMNLYLMKIIIKTTAKDANEMAKKISSVFISYSLLVMTLRIRINS